MGCNLEDVKSLSETIDRLRDKIKNNSEYRNDILLLGKEYSRIKSYFQEFVEFLRYTHTIMGDSFYRVRKAEGNHPFTSKKEIIYPEPSVEHKNRMSNIGFCVLYVSLHEFTAMAEAQIDNSFVNKYFQLTRFSTINDLAIFKLGLFGNLYLNSPRDSEYVKQEMNKLFGSEYHDRTIQGYAALECVMADILYDQSDDYHLLSSILADAIFSKFNNIDAILYPTVQNRYGLNLAIKKNAADNLNVAYSSLNKLAKVYKNGFFKYYTLEECHDFSNNDLFKFEEVKKNCCYR